MEMEKMFHMNVGLGDSSYAQNSTMLQKRALNLGGPLLEENILSMKMAKSERFCIAELGCSSGPNALLGTENIIKVLRAKYLSAGIPVPQFQVFFNDLPATDFNSLFKTLPHSVTTDGNYSATSYFAAGVPGSFYGRLFPDQSIQFFHSSYNLHWLSQISPEILKKNSVTWNKGKMEDLLQLEKPIFVNIRRISTPF